MEAKDLRLGNLVWNETQKIAVPVDMKILSEQLYSKTKWPPVQLTEEWFYRFGFEEYNKTLVFKIKANEYWSLGELKQGYLKIKLTKANNWRVENFGNKSIYLKTVHQLQNFYFTLTENELKLK